MKFVSVDACVEALEDRIEGTSPVQSYFDAERRLKAGQKQRLCAACKRWKWRNERCNHFVDGGSD